MLDQSSLRRRLEVATEAATYAGEIALKYFQTDVEVERKSDDSPVTIADRTVEDLLVKSLSAAFPEDGILGEEHGEKPGTSGCRWLLDPIDGTQSFVRGVPLFGVMVALVADDEEVLLGVVHMPALRETVSAARGEGCFCNGARTRVSSVATLAESCVLFTEFPVDESQLAAFERVRSLVRVVRGWGDCYGHMLVATGRADVMLDPILSDWDSAPLSPIVEEAGGTFTDWSGRRTAFGKSGVSTNGHLRDELFRSLNGLS